MTPSHDSQSPSIPSRARRGLTALLLAAAVAGCGRKGALYMPGEEEDARRLPRTPPGSEGTTPESEETAPAETERLPDVEEDD